MKFNRLSKLLFVPSLIVFGQVPMRAQPPQAAPPQAAPPQAAPPQAAPPQAAPPQNEAGTYIKDNYTKREVMIPMRDGVKLFTSIYEPKDKSQTYPIMLDRTPYSVGPYGEDKYKRSLGPNRLFAKEGFIFVYQDVRGCWKSEGEFENVRPEVAAEGKAPIDESTDSYDTVDWLIKNVEGNNGRVGVWGISYPGLYTSTAIINGHPAIKAASPQAPVSDWFHGDDMHHNGALFLAQNYDFFGSFGQARLAPTATDDYLKKSTGRVTQDGYDYFRQLGGLKETADSYQKDYGVRIKFWDEMMAHPNYDGYWKDRNVLPKLKGVKAAVMTVGGWYDNEDLYGALQTYQHIEQQNPGIFNVLVVGPWFHGGWEGGSGDFLGTAYFGAKTALDYQTQIELPFFNYFLKDKGDISNINEVNLFDTGANAWKDFSSYNPNGSADTALYLGAGGSLTFSPPAKPAAKTAPKTKPGFDEYVSDPLKPVPYTQKISLNYPRDYMTEDQRFASTRPDVLVYSTQPLTEDVTVAGDIKPSLFVSSSGTDSDFVVKIIDVFPDDYRYPEGVRAPINSAYSVFDTGGYQMLLRGEPMPARFRNSFENPAPLKPNQPTKLGWTMPGILHTFKKGHRIMVQIQSTWFPLVARNPQQYMKNYQLASAADFQKATERIYFGGAHNSMIMLPIIKK